jgi:cellulose synthase operon protein C
MARATAAILLLAGALALAACDTAEERAEAHYQRGLQLLEAGEVERAMVELRNVFRLDGNHHDARLVYANQLVEMGEIAEAVGQFRRLLEQDWTNVEGHKNLAELAFAIDDYQTAATHTERAYELDPTDPEIRARKAMVDYYDGRQEEGRAMARAVLEERPDLLPARMLLVWDRWERQDFAGMHALIDAGLEAAPESWELHSARFWLLEREDDTAAVGEQLHRMAELYPDSDMVAQWLIGWHLREGDADAAEAILRERTASMPADTPERIEADLRLVHFLLAVRGPEAARGELERLAAEAADVQPYRRALAGLDMDAGNVERAIATLEEIISTAEPSDARRDSQIVLAEILLATGRMEESDALVETVLTEDANHVGGLKLRARRQIDTDRPDDAVRTLRAALHQEPRDASLLTLMAAAHERAGAYELAGERLAMAVQVSERAPAESLRYARFLLKNDRDGAAEAVIVDSLRRHPEDPDLLVALGRLHLQRQDWAQAGQVARRLRAGDAPAAERLAAALEADVLRGQSRFEEALDTIRSLSETDSARALVGIVQTYLLADNLAGARAYVDDMLARAPGDRGIRMINAALLVLAGESAEAEEVYRAIIADAAAYAPAYVALHGLLFGDGRTDEAAEILREGLAATAGDPNLMFLEAGRLEREGDFEGAIAIYEDLYARDTASVLVANNLASLIATHRADAAELERAFSIARRLRGTDVPQFADTYGWILSRRGDHEAALPYLERAAAALAGDPLVQYHLGVTQYRLGKTAAARETLERALASAGPDSTLPQMREVRSLLDAIGAAETAMSPAADD